MSEEFKEALPSVINALVSGTDAETDAQMADIAPVIQQFVKRDPDEFNLTVLFPWSQLLEAGIRRAFAGRAAVLPTQDHDGDVLV